MEDFIIYIGNYFQFENYNFEKIYKRNSSSLRRFGRFWKNYNFEKICGRNSSFLRGNLEDFYILEIIFNLRITILRSYVEQIVPL